MTRAKMVKESLILAITILAMYHAVRSVFYSGQRQIFLHREAIALRSGQVQAEEVNKELRDGLSNYRSSSGLERLARERLNLAGPNEIIVRISK